MMKQYEVLQKYLDGAMPLKTRPLATPKRLKKAPKAYMEHCSELPFAEPQTSEKNSRSNPI
jgi:hypothetical protein